MNFNPFRNLFQPNGSITKEAIDEYTCNEYDRFITIKQVFNRLIVYEKGNDSMKKNYKIDVDCANCANKMEEAAKRTPGVKDAVVNFMALKMVVEFEEGQDPKTVMQEVLKNCKKVEDDCEIFF